MMTVNMHQAKTPLAALIALVETNHEEVRVCRNGKPVARIVAETGLTRPDRTLRAALAPLHVEDDLTAPLTLDDWPHHAP